METLAYVELAEAAKAAPRPAPQARQTVARLSAPSAFVAQLLFAAGVASFAIFEAPKPAGQPAVEPSAAPLPQPAPEAALPAAAAPEVLAPYDPAQALTPQYEDGLVPFSLSAPIVNESPVLPALGAAPAAVAAFAVQPAPEEKMVEHVARRPSLRAANSEWLSSDADPAGFKRLHFVSSLWHAGGPGLRGKAALAGTVLAAAIIRGSVGVREAMANINTDYARRGMFANCNGLGTRCTTDAQGRPSVDLGNGQKWIYGGYDQSKDFGQRNTIIMQDALGNQTVTHMSPLVFDLSGRGVRVSDGFARFDLSGDGRISTIHDIGSGTGVLVFRNRDGVAGGNGSQLFGDRTDLEGRGRPDGFVDGFEALAGLVKKAEREGVLPEGTLAGGRLDARSLAALAKAYGLGMRRGSLTARTISLEEAGVGEIRLSNAPSMRTADFDGQGSDVVRRAGASFVRADGTTGSYEDVFFSYQRPTLYKVALAR